MPADLQAKTDRYERMLADALDEADLRPPADTPLGSAAAECREMASSYLDDGRHFREAGDPVNALAAFSYGHAWLDAGMRLGYYETDRDELFAA